MRMEKGIKGLALWMGVFVGLMGGASLEAATLETPHGRLGIFGYNNALYTYMSSMAMKMNNQIKRMPDTSTFETDGNLLFQAEFMPIRVKVNLEYHNPVEIQGQHEKPEIQGTFLVLEAFGEYEWGPGLHVRAGHFLAPFGIYNAIRYVTPLFASVVLPMMYDPPMNYTGGALVPDKANLMAWGKLPGNWGDYFLYMGNGELKGDGHDQNKNKALGVRVRLRVPGGFLGGSLRQVNNDLPRKPGEGEETLWGVDLDLHWGAWNLQTEYAKDDAQRQPHRYAYYARVTYQGLRWTPFVAYDFLMDRGDPDLFSRGMHRYSTGLGYNVNPNLVIKAEYHYHRFAHRFDDPELPDDIHMFRVASIFLF